MKRRYTFGQDGEFKFLTTYKSLRKSHEIILFHISTKNTSYYCLHKYKL